MGCNNSKVMFKVINIDKDDNHRHSGKIEVTDTDLIFYKKGRVHSSWPLNYIRKYGGEKNIFVFECGTKCDTGEGIFKFRCDEAEELFNVFKIKAEKSLQNPIKNPINQIETNELKTLETSANEKYFPDKNKNTLKFEEHSYTNEFPETTNYLNTFTLRNEKEFFEKKKENLIYTNLEETKLCSNEKLITNDYVNNVINLDDLEKTDSLDKHELNYTTLDLGTYNGNSFVVTTAPVTPLTKDFKFDEFSNIYTPVDKEFSTSNRQPYSTIDFSKTNALFNTVCNRK